MSSRYKWMLLSLCFLVILVLSTYTTYFQVELVPDELIAPSTLGLLSDDGTGNEVSSEETQGDFDAEPIGMEQEEEKSAQTGKEDFENFRAIPESEDQQRPSAKCTVDGKRFTTTQKCEDLDNEVWVTVLEPAKGGASKVSNTSVEATHSTIAPKGYCHASSWNGLCLGELPHAEAEEYCLAQGARLCSLQELKRGLHLGVGQPPLPCHSKPGAIWTSTACELQGKVEGMMVAASRYTMKPLDWWPYEACVPPQDLETRRALVMCCADTRGVVTGQCDKVPSPGTIRRETKRERAKEWEETCGSQTTPFKCASEMSGKYADFPFPSVDGAATLLEGLESGDDCHWNHRCTDWTTGAGRWVNLHDFENGVQDELIANPEVKDEFGLEEEDGANMTPPPVVEAPEGRPDKPKAKSMMQALMMDAPPDVGEEVIGGGSRLLLGQEAVEESSLLEVKSDEFESREEETTVNDQGKGMSSSNTESDALLEYHPQKCWFYRFREPGDIQECLGVNAELVLIGDSQLYRVFTCTRKRFRDAGVPNVSTDCVADVDIPAAQGVSSAIPRASFNLPSGRRVSFYATPTDQESANNLLMKWKQGCDSLKEDPSSEDICPSAVLVNQWPGISFGEFEDIQSMSDMKLKTTLVSNQSLIYRRLLNQLVTLRNHGKVHSSKKGSQPSIHVYWVTTPLAGRGLQVYMSRVMEYNAFLKENIIRTPAMLVDWFDLSITYPRRLTEEGTAKAGLYDSLLTAFLNRLCERSIRTLMVRSSGQLCQSKRCSTCSARVGHVPASRVEPSLINWVRQHSSPVVFKNYLEPYWNMSWEQVYNITLDNPKLSIQRLKRRYKLGKYFKDVVLQTKKVMPEQSTLYGGNVKIPPRLMNEFKIHVPRELSPRGLQTKAGIWFGVKHIGVPLHKDKVNGGHMLFQYLGREHIVLLPPTVTSLSYLHLNKERGYMQSSVGRINDVDFQRYPKFVGALISSMQVNLSPGDLIFIPNGWMYSATPAEPSWLVSYWMKSSKINTV